jgi:hypothetical protein
VLPGNTGELVVISVQLRYKGFFQQTRTRTICGTKVEYTRASLIPAKETVS